MSMIDVIVPCYRYGHFVRECVESILSQEVDGLRVLIIDDASPDDTPLVSRALEEEDSRVTVLRHATNQGIIATLNEGVEWASGKYMLIISADDLLFPGALSRAIRLMDAHPQVGFTCGRALEVQGQCSPGWHETQIDDGYRIFSGTEFLDRSGSRNTVYAPTAVVRTALQKQVGGYRKELPHAADTEMWFRLAAHGAVGVIKAYQAVYRIHGSNFSLAYAKQGGLPDFVQRQAAVNCFADACKNVLADAERRRRRMLRSLSVEALGSAGSAFNSGDFSVANELHDFAVRACPAARWSVKGFKITLKRALGPTVWRLVRPLTVTARRFARKVASWVSLHERRDMYRC